MRRLFFGLLAALLLSPMSVSSVLSAQEATPATIDSRLADLGLPTLDVTVTADGYEGIPDSVEAGRYLITITVSEDVADVSNFDAGVAFIQPVGVSVDEFVGLLEQMAESPEDTNAGDPPATPIAEAQASPAGEGGPGLPPFLFDSIFAGGTYAAVGESAQIVLDLPPGEWVAWGDDPAAPWAPVPFEVIGEMPTDLVEPSAGATLTMGEYVIELTEGELVVGPQVIRVDNIGAQPHFISGLHTAKDITMDDVGAILESEMTGTPATIDLDPDTDFEGAFFTGTQSTGTTQWVQVDLSAGNVVVVCFFPDISDGMPHAFHGMYNILRVGK